MIATIEQLKEKIELFRKNLKDYKSKNYDEYNTRADFIDVMFSSLGWDMYNEQKIIEQFREVVREVKIIIDGTKKAPDYSFRIGPHIVFYVEAKKPSVDVKNDMTPALQLRRYAHTRGLALSIVTDFEEVAVYDTRIKPDKKDSAAVARVFYCTYDELFLPCKIEGYQTNYDFLLNTFGKQAVLNGSFNRYVETNKKGTTSVDKGFLELLNKWREKLAENIALKNEEIDEYNLNISVQKLIDRLIFLRIAEDRLIEKPDLLKEITHKDNVYLSLNNIFAVADLKYNSNLFSSEAWMVALNIDDKVLNEIIDEMYPPKCPYEFSVLPIEILGHAYEQFLGKTIKFSRKTKFGHSIEIEEKPEVRKAGGVYYTPDYIVDYIVENTVGEKINGNRNDGTSSSSGNTGTSSGIPSPRTPGGGKADKGAQPLTPEEIVPLKILDPACGSGSFLIGAYDYLIRYHLEFYLKNKTRRDKAQSAGIIYEVGEGKYKLSTKTKSEILVNNIFGVDIDQQAVEVTKLSLLLKVLEDENLEYKEKLFKTEQLHMLPDLSANIKCGNSLIGSDYYADKNLEMFGTAEMRKVNVFDWGKEFKEVFSRGGAEKGGFDCIIGNPPYVPMESILIEQKEYFQNHFNQLERKYDTSIVFILAFLDKLKTSGLLGYISSLTWQTGENYSRMREYIFTNFGVVSLINLPFNTFKDAYVDTGVYILSGSKTDSYNIYRFPKKESITILRNIAFNRISTDLIQKPSYKVILDSTSAQILSKINSNNLVPLGEISISTQGLAVNKFELLNEDSEETYQFLESGQVYRYLFLKEKVSFTNMSDKSSLLIFYKSNPKILIRRVINRQDRLMCTFCDEEIVFKKDINPFILHSLDKNDTLYVLSIMNSKLISYIYINISSIATKDDFRQTTLTELRNLPLPKFDYSKDKGFYLQLINLVSQMLIIQKDFYSTGKDSDRKVLQQKIDAVDKQIDRLVYELYGLTEDEIKIVEGGD